MTDFVSADTMSAPCLAKDLPRIVDSNPTDVLGESRPKEQGPESKTYWADPWEAMNTFANRSRPRVEGDKRTDRCRAVKLLPGCFGRSDEWHLVLANPFGH